MAEQSIQSKIIKFLKSIGCYAVVNIVSSKSGVADITACLPDGRYLAVEVKQPGKTMRPLQLHHMKEVHKSNGLGLEATSVEQVKQYLAIYGYGEQEAI